MCCPHSEDNPEVTGAIQEALKRANRAAISQAQRLDSGQTMVSSNSFKVHKNKNFFGSDFEFCTILEFLDRPNFFLFFKSVMNPVRHVTGNDKDYLRKSPEWFGRNPRLTKGHYRSAIIGLAVET